MKTTLISVFFIFCLTANAIPYKSILGTNIAKWTIIILPDYEQTEEWFTNSDTVFNQIKYKSLNRYQTNQLYYGGNFYNKPFNITDSVWKFNSPITIQMNTEHFIRESSDASKLYLYDSNLHKEYLISDLNLQKGDSFYLPADSKHFLRYYEDYVHVDSIYYIKGLKYVQFNLLAYYSTLKMTFIEGVGPNLGIFYMYGGGNNASIFCLNCFKNDILFYKQFNNRPCAFDNINALENVFDNSFELFQTKNELHLSFNTIDNRLISIYDLTGKNVFRKQFTYTNKVDINKQLLQKGIYIIHSINLNKPNDNVNKTIIIN